MKNQISLLFAALSALTLTPAHADVATNLPGMQCVATTGTLEPTSSGEVENPSTTGTASGSCPVERPIAPTVATKLSAKIFVLDRSPTGNVCCFVSSRNPGGASETSALVCSSGSSSTYQQLNTTQITDSATYSQFAVNCVVPPASSGNTSRIIGYRPSVE